MSATYDWLCISDELGDEERAIAIAAVLRTGHPSSAFCLYLSGMIDPRPGAKNTTPWKFVPRRRHRGRPRGSEPILDYEVLIALAQEIGARDPSVGFCLRLAGLIDPCSDVSTWKLVFKKARSGRPESTNWKVGDSMEQLVDIEHWSVEAAIAEVSERYGVGRTTCLMAMREVRKRTRAGEILDRN